MTLFGKFGEISSTNSVNFDPARFCKWLAFFKRSLRTTMRVKGLQINQTNAHNEKSPNLYFFPFELQHSLKIQTNIDFISSLFILYCFCFRFCHPLPSSSLLFNINANFVHRNMQRNKPNETKRAFVLHQISHIFAFDFVIATLHELNEVVAAVTTTATTKPCTRVSHSFDAMA